jgi:hypothetical protein
VSTAPVEPETPTGNSESASVPIPVLAPYLGLVASVLCTLGGGWLLLAPFALDLRHGAKHLPRSMRVDLDSGAAIVALGVMAAVLFSVNLVMRLQPEMDAVPEPVAVSRPEPEIEPDPEPELEPEPEPEPAAKDPDPGGALRELLTPLVAALAADLRSHDQDRGRAETGGADDEAHDDTHRRQEP